MNIWIFSKRFLIQPIYESQNFRMRETTPGSDTSHSSDAFPDKGRHQQGMSQLSSNLTELDQLLQDLNSAQFIADVDKKPPGSIN